MRLTILSLVLVLFVGNATVSAQVVDRPSAFIGANAGALRSNVAGFESFYASRVALGYGAFLGIPITNSAFVLFKVDGFTKSNVSITGLSYYIGIPLSSPHLVTGTVCVTQWMFNLGVMKVLHFGDQFGIGGDAGLTYLTFAASLSIPAPGSYAPPPPVPNHRALGVFMGIVGEFRFADSRWALVLEPEYTQLWTIGATHFASYGDLLVSAGLRFYFKGH